MSPEARFNSGRSTLDARSDRTRRGARAQCPLSRNTSWLSYTMVASLASAARSAGIPPLRSWACRTSESTAARAAAAPHAHSAKAERTCFAARIPRRARREVAANWSAKSGMSTSLHAEAQAGGTSGRTVNGWRTISTPEARDSRRAAVERRWRIP